MTNPKEDEYIALISEGVDFFQKKKYQQALASFWMAFRIRPYAPVVLFNLGRALEEVHDPQAVHLYEAAVGQGSVDASFQLAMIYGLMGNMDAAKEHLKRYISTTPVKNDAHFKWAKTTLASLSPTLTLVWDRAKNISKIDDQI